MDDPRKRPVLVGGARRIVVFAIASIVCDVLVAVMSYADWHAFVAAPSSASLAPEDDISFALSGMGFGVSSLLRYLVLIGFAIVLSRYRISRGRRSSRDVVVTVPRSWAPLAGALLAVEVLYVAAAWTEADPSGIWFLTRLTACVISAGISVLILTRLLAALLKASTKLAGINELAH